MVLLASSKGLSKHLASVAGALAADLVKVGCRLASSSQRALSARKTCWRLGLLHLSGAGVLM